MYVIVIEQKDPFEEPINHLSPSYGYFMSTSNLHLLAITLFHPFLSLLYLKLTIFVVPTPNYKTDIIKLTSSIENFLLQIKMELRINF